MDIPHRLVLACACLISLISAGCAANYPYQPYPYQQYPGGSYGQPNYMGPPIGAPPGGVQLNAPTPTPINPGTTNGGSSSGGEAPMWDPDAGAGSSGSSESNNNVPFYDDPNSGNLPAPDSTQKPKPFDSEKTTFGEGENPFGLNQTPTAESPGVRNVAFEADAKTAAQPNLELASHESLERVPRASHPGTIKAPAPVALTSAEFERPIERTRAPGALSLPYDPESFPNPFGHDSEGYRTLQGLVSYDDELRAWTIIYNDKPSRDDQFGGVFTLADHTGLTVLNNNDVIYVEGHVSETVKDEFGKPLYIVEHLSKLKPRSQQ